jgi:hypothetical protein
MDWGSSLFVNKPQNTSNHGYEPLQTDFLPLSLGFYSLLASIKMTT